MMRRETERLAIERTRAEGELGRIAELDVRNSLARTPPPPFRGPSSRWLARSGHERERGIAR